MTRTQNLDALNELTKVGESVLWTGTPVTGVRFPPVGSSPLFLTGLIVIAIFVFGLVKSILLIWALLGAVVVTGYFVIYLIIRATVIYRITDQRIIIFSDFGTRSVRQLSIDSIKTVNLRKHSDGTGTIIFNDRLWHGLPYWSPSPTNSLMAPRFEFIDGPNEVYEIIEKARMKE